MAKYSAKTQGPISIGLEIDDDVLSVKLSKVAQSLDDWRRFWSQFWGPQFFADVQKNFAQEGDPVGGWRALSPEYAAWKLRHFGPKPILVRSGAMKESLRMGGRLNVFRAFKAYAELGSLVKYLPFHQRGTRRMPRRQVLWIGPTVTYKRLLVRFVKEEFARAGFPVTSRAV